MSVENLMRALNRCALEESYLTSLHTILNARDLKWPNLENWVDARCPQSDETLSAHCEKS